MRKLVFPCFTWPALKGLKNRLQQCFTSPSLYSLTCRFFSTCCSRIENKCSEEEHAAEDFSAANNTSNLGREKKIEHNIWVKYMYDKSISAVIVLELLCLRGDDEDCAERCRNWKSRARFVFVLRIKIINLRIFRCCWCQLPHRWCRFVIVLTQIFNVYHRISLSLSPPHLFLTQSNIYDEGKSRVKMCAGWWRQERERGNRKKKWKWENKIKWNIAKCCFESLPTGLTEELPSLTPTQQ